MRAAASSSNLHHDSDSDSENTTELNKTRTSGRSFYRRGSSFFGKQDDKQARMELKMIVESSKDAMFCIDEKGKILLTNSASVRQFGYSMNELIGSNISIICNAHDASKHGEYIERYLRTGEKRAMGKNREILAKKKDGSTFFIELGLTEVNCGGKFIFCGFVKDITNLKRHRKTLERNTSMMGTDNQEEGGDNARAHGIPFLVEWCLVILSEFVDNHGYGRLSGGGEDENMESSRSLMDSSMASLKSSLTNIKYRNGASPVVEMMDTMVVEKVAAIPHLLEELLLVEDPEARSRIFDMSIVHKVLFNVDSLGNGNW